MKIVYLFSLFFLGSLASPSSLVSDLFDGPNEHGGKSHVRTRSRAAESSSLFKIASPKISSRIDISGYLKAGKHEANDVALHVADKFVAAGGEERVLVRGTPAQGNAIDRLAKYRAYLDATRNERLATSDYTNFESVPSSYIKSELQDWRKFTDASKGMTELEKVTRANNFINHRVTFVNDVTDVWKPLMTTFIQGGDCEDLAFAKMETLKEMGVPEDRLQAAYVRVPGYGAHMVLLYVTPDDKTTYVLDNLDNRLRTTEEDRLSQKYLFIFSFNKKHLLAYDPSRQS